MVKSASKKTNPDEFMFDAPVSEPEIIPNPEEQQVHYEHEEVSNASQASNLSGKPERTAEPIKLGEGSFDNSMEQIVSAVVNKLSTTLQSLCVSDRVVAAQAGLKYHIPSEFAC